MVLTGVEQIEIERQRQILDEGFDADHDDTHRSSTLTCAALSYAEVAAEQLHPHFTTFNEWYTRTDWPWDAVWWKPSYDPIRNLVVAGALIAAEIDRLQRKESQ